MLYTHQSVRDYVEAKKRGDRATTDGSEAAELLDATMSVRFGEYL